MTAETTRRGAVRAAHWSPVVSYAMNLAPTDHDGPAELATENDEQRAARGRGTEGRQGWKAGRRRGRLLGGAPEGEGARPDERLGSEGEARHDAGHQEFQQAQLALESLESGVPFPIARGHGPSSRAWPG